MVPTFCAEQLDPSPLEVPPGSARAGEGDLPLIGDGGGEPKRESSSSSGWLTLASISISVCILLFGAGVKMGAFGGYVWGL